MTLVFLQRYWEAHKLSPSPRWSPSQGPRSRLGNSMDNPRLSLHASGSPVCLSTSLSRIAPRHLHYQASGQNVAGLVPSGTRWRPHHKHGWCDLARLTSPAKHNNGVRKHWVVRSVQTKLNTRPKPRASAYERGLMNLITSQNTYANHQIFH
jgi:hypothetical protein